MCVCFCVANMYAREKENGRTLSTRSHSFDGGFDSHLFIQRKSFVGNAYITMNIFVNSCLLTNMRACERARAHSRTLTF